MPPLTVVEDLDVLSDGRLDLGAGQIAAIMNEFVLQTAPEALHRSVFVAILDGSLPAFSPESLDARKREHNGGGMVNPCQSIGLQRKGEGQ